MLKLAPIFSAVLLSWSLSAQAQEPVPMAPAPAAAPEPPAPTPVTSRSARIAGWSLVAAGSIPLTLSAVYFVKGTVENGGSCDRGGGDAQCPTGDMLPPALLFAGGLGLTVAGVVVLATGSSSKASPERTGFTPYVGPRGGGATFRASF